MLRRVTTFTVTVQGRRYSVTALRLNNTNNSNPYSSDDQADMEREKKLREQFAQKMMKGQVKPGEAPKSPWEMFKAMQEMQRQAQAAGGQQGGQQQQGGAGGGSMDEAAMRKEKWEGFLRILFYLTTIYLIIFVSQITDPNSRLSLFQGIPWRYQSVDNVAYYMLVRSVLSTTEMKKLQTDYANAVKQYPTLTLSQFIQQTEPNMFVGRRTSTQEIIGALCACVASNSNELAVNKTVIDAVGWSGGERVDKIDKIMDALRSNHSQVFHPATYTPGGAFGSQ